ncbi:MAG: PepSY domain-containing protein [Gammaproteobacteria bacterium]
MKGRQSISVSFNRLALAATIGALMYAAPALAKKEPPANAMPLSKIIQSIEQQGELAYFDEVEWDSDGYWEVEYYAKDGSKRKVKIDPVSGEVRR